MEIQNQLWQPQMNPKLRWADKRCSSHPHCNKSWLYCNLEYKWSDSLPGYDGSETTTKWSCLAIHGVLFISCCCAPPHQGKGVTLSCLNTCWMWSVIMDAHLERPVSHIIKRPTVFTTCTMMLCETWHLAVYHRHHLVTTAPPAPAHSPSTWGAHPLYN